jgi:hypothetical protein
VTVTRTRTVGAFFLVAIGLVWIGQGLGLFRGQSFMVGDIRWAVIGLTLVIGGLAWGLAGRRRGGRA